MARNGLCSAFLPELVFNCEVFVVLVVAVFWEDGVFAWQSLFLFSFHHTTGIFLLFFLILFF